MHALPIYLPLPVCLTYLTLTMYVPYLSIYPLLSAYVAYHKNSNVAVSYKKAKIARVHQNISGSLARNKRSWRFSIEQQNAQQNA